MRIVNRVRNVGIPNRENPEVGVLGKRGTHTYLINTYGSCASAHQLTDGSKRDGDHTAIVNENCTNKIYKCMNENGKELMKPGK